MIARSGKDNFLVAHYDWIAAGVGALALVGAVAFCLVGGDVEDEISEVTGRIGAGRIARAAVAEQDMGAYAAATNAAKAKARAAFVANKADAFFASAKRLLCANAACGRATPEKFDAGKNLVCAFCGFTQEVAKAEVVLDADGDGLPDAWENLHGLNPKDPADAEADADGDGFTNLEEFQAKTDPKDRASHHDYLDSLKIVLPLKEKQIPFVFLAANKIPTGWRCEFFDAKLKDDYGRLGRTVTAVIDEEIGKSGFVLKSYEKKSVKRAIKGSVNKREIDVSEVVVERKGDGKKVTIVRAESKKSKPVAVDIQATLAYERGNASSFEVVPGSEIDLNGAKYRIREIKAVGKGAKVTVEEVKTGKTRILEALEP